MKNQDDIIELILRDHKPLKKHIKTLKEGEGERLEKESTFEDFVPLLVAHAKAEEKSLYVKMKDTKELRREAYEGDTEHTLAEQLIHEINACADDDKWCAKVKVLAELVDQHITEEETKMLKEVELHLDLETRRVVGDVYTDIKTQIESLRRPLKVLLHRDREASLN